MMETKVEKVNGNGTKVFEVWGTAKVIVRHRIEARTHEEAMADVITKINPYSYEDVHLSIDTYQGTVDMRLPDIEYIEWEAVFEDDFEDEE